jgi:hypothetical protein
MNIQQAFDDAVRFIVKQGAPGHGNGGCVYLDERSGNRCAIGALLPEALCVEIEHDGGVEAVWNRIAGRLEDRYGEMVRDEEFYEGFFGKLQEAHDCSIAFGAFVPEFLNRAERLAEEYNLSQEVIAECSRS